ncbi:MAG: hypothetical protein KAX31_06350, partial [Thermoplasmata archaeon]|nr:hypothetical protein [Thermoplasmata archaeon]
MKARRQATGGDITGWDAEDDISNVDNTNTIYGDSIRSMGDAGPVKSDMMVVYKEGAALRSRYYDGDWNDPIEDIDTSTLPGQSAFDFEHGEEIGVDMGHVVYIDADASVQWKERDSGTAPVWSAAEQLHAADVTHRSVGIIEHGSGWLWVTWAHGNEAEYRLHQCVPETWWSLLANPPLTFDPTTIPPAVVDTTTIDQLQTPDIIPAGSAIP